MDKRLEQRYHKKENLIKYKYIKGTQHITYYGSEIKITLKIHYTKMRGAKKMVAKIWNNKKAQILMGVKIYMTLWVQLTDHNSVICKCIKIMCRYALVILLHHMPGKQ